DGMPKSERVLSAELLSAGRAMNGGGALEHAPCAQRQQRALPPRFLVEGPARNRAEWTDDVRNRGAAAGCGRGERCVRQDAMNVHEVEIADARLKPRRQASRVLERLAEVLPE